MDKCIVPLSGGLDSTVIYYYARDKGLEIQAVGYDYGQKHRDKELVCAQKTIYRTKQENLKILDLTFFKDIVTTSALTNDDIDVAKAKDVLGDPQTVNYVPRWVEEFYWTEKGNNRGHFWGILVANLTLGFRI